MKKTCSRKLKDLGWLVVLVLCLVTSIFSQAYAQEPKPDEPKPAANDTSPWNADLPTFGGKQFWTDEFVYLDWRIQRQVVTQHYRLLDDKNIRRAWGTWDQCSAEFLRLKRELNLPPLQPRVVIVLHGLVRSRDSMEGTCRYLREQSGFSVLNFSYASTREKIPDHAAALARVVSRLEGVQDVSFVAHSLGNLIVRCYLADRARANPEPTLPKVHRIVMLAPPNNGTELAGRFRDHPVFRLVWGESGRELAEDWGVLEKRLAIPGCPFGVIAGGKGDDKGRNPLLHGDDDFVVSVDETRLAGAHDFVVVPALHGTIMDQRPVQEMTLRFLEHGYFTAEDSRQPIPVTTVEKRE